MSMKKRWIAVTVLAVLILVGVAAWIIADESIGKTALTTVSEAESGIVVSNSYASEITRTSATLNLSFSKTYITRYELYIGKKPDSMNLVRKGNVGKNVPSLTVSVDGLEDYTRYYYCFHLFTPDKEIVLDSWSFVTPSSYFNGASGGKNDENVTYGVDVSFWCKTSDFEKAKAAGIDFVIIRAGSTGNKDPYFEENYERAKAAGLKVGAYYYTYAMSVAEAEADAEEYMSFICGKQFDMPVYVDIENISQQSLSRQLLTEMTISFCDRIAATGYYAGVYANRNWFTTLLNYDTLAPVYELWIARWTDDGTPNEDYSDRFGVWQYYDKGRVDGIQGNADLNVCYKDYSSIINNDGTVPYDFIDWDGNVICTYYMYPGNRIYTPAKLPARETDDVYEYEFVGWEGLDEDTVATETGGSFTAVYNKIAHSYGDWESIWVMERKRTCEDCGHEQHEILGDLTCGENATWYFSDGTLTVSGSGAIKDGKSLSDFGWSVVSDSITKIVVEEGITSIGNYAFSDLGQLVNVRLPMTLKSVGDSAFANCLSLASINIPAGTRTISETAFEGCKNLKNVSGYETSTNGKKLAEAIGAKYSDAKPVLAYFRRTSSGVNWYLYTDGRLLISGIGAAPDEITDDLEAYRLLVIEVTVGAGVTSVPDDMLVGAELLKKVEFLSTKPVTVGKYAFSDCRMLTMLFIPRGSVIEEGAFVGSPIVQ